MRPKNPSRTKLSRTKPSLLQEESLRMQTKLDDLKKYLQDKKNAQKSKVASESRFAKEVKSFLGVKKEDELVLCYRNLKIEAYEEVLREEGINTIKQLKELKELDVERLPIPPGFRIKLKKFLFKSQVETGRKATEPVDIEEIIFKREEMKESKKHKASPNKFDPLENKEGQPEDLSKSFLQSLEMSKQMGAYTGTEKEYLNDYFLIEQRSQPRILKSSFRDKALRIDKKVTWDTSLPECEGTKVYPKENFVKDNHYPQGQISVCWQCLKRSTSSVVFNSHAFCSDLCQKKYREAMMKACFDCQRQIPVNECFMELCEDCFADKYQEGEVEKEEFGDNQGREEMQKKENRVEISKGEQISDFEEDVDLSF